MSEGLADVPKSQLGRLRNPGEAGNFDNTNRSLVQIDRAFGNQLIPAVASVIAQQVAVARILDVVCGTQAVAVSELAKRYPETQFVGLNDKFSQPPKTGLPNLELREGDAFSNSLEQGSFDLAYCYGFPIYYEIPDQPDQLIKLLTQITTALKAGGQAFVDMNFGYFSKIPKTTVTELETQTGAKFTPLKQGVPIFKVGDPLGNKMTYWLDGRGWIDDRVLRIQKQK